MRGLDYLGAAYVGIWAGFFFYLLALGRRARRLEQEVRTLRENPSD